MDASSQQPGPFSYYMLTERAPRYSVIDTDFGAMYGAYRDTDDGRRYWRVANYLFPFWSMPPQGLLGHKVTARGWVPMDDTHTMFVFDLSQYEDVKSNAAGIYDRLADGSMPCDEAWPEERVALFRQWIEAGSPP